MTEKNNGAESRAFAAEVVGRWLRTDDFPDRLIPDAIRDRAFVMDIVYGTVRRWRTLEYALASFVKKRPAGEVRPYLLVGAYQILFMPDVPDHAAIHETVEASKALPLAKSRFVNAVLRNIQRNRESLLTDIAHADAGVRESHPDELVARWRSAFGEDVAGRICQTDNLPAETTLTALPFGDAAHAVSLLGRFAEAGIPARRHPVEESAIVIGRGVPVRDLPGYNEGLFVVQDAAPLAALRLLAPKRGETILDACAAPGGKTLQIAASVGDSGGVIAMDLHEDRLARLRENVSRAQFADRVDVLVGDASSAEVVAALKGRNVDAVLADVPCSNTGVLRRRVDARWRFGARRLAALHRTQLSILSNVAGLFADSPASSPRIVYSTCSIEKEEDEDVVDEFLALYPDWRLADSVRMLPDDSPCDGAYAARLERKP